MARSRKRVSYVDRHRRGTVYVNNLRETVEALRAVMHMSYRALAKKIEVPVMTLWDGANEGASDTAFPTHKKNYNAIHSLANDVLSGVHRLHAYPTYKEARRAATPSYRRSKYMSDQAITDKIDLSNRAHLKRIRTLYNEFGCLSRGDDGYMSIYTTDSDDAILEGLKGKIAYAMSKDPTWITKVPDEILLFADAAGLIPKDLLDEEPDDKVELTDEPEEEDDDDSPEEEDADEPDDDDDELSGMDDEDDASDEDDTDEVDDVTDDEPEDSDDEAGLVYEIRIEDESSAGVLSKLLQEVVAGLNSEAQTIEIIKPSASSVKVTPQPATPKKGKHTAGTDVEDLRKRMRVGGDLLSRDKRIGFITSNGVPFTGKLADKSPKELFNLIVAWAEAGE